MKTMYKLLGVIALVAIAGFSMAACSSNASNDPEPIETFTRNEEGGAKYTLQIFRDDPARYTRQEGDRFILIIVMDGNTFISAGTVVGFNSATGVFTLQPNPGAGGVTLAVFSIRVSTDDSNEITGLPRGGVPVNGGDVEEAPGGNFAIPPGDQNILLPASGGGGGGSSGGGGGSSGGGGTPPGPTPGLAFTRISGVDAYEVSRGTVTSGAVVIPATHNGHPVTLISREGFLNTAITSVVIPDSVTTIGDSAFSRCTALASVTMGNGVTVIGWRAFADTGLTSVTIPSSVTVIDDDAFRESGLTSVTIPDSVTAIGIQAFFNCTALASVTMGNSVTTIGTWAFAGCTALTSIYVDAGNPNYLSSNGVLYNKAKTTLIQYPAGLSAISFIIPASVTTIGTLAFGGCTALTSITIPNSVTTIGSSAFANTGLTSVVIPDSVTAIGMQAFDRCTALTSLAIHAPTPPTLAGSALLNTHADLRIIVPAGSAALYRAAANWNANGVRNRIHSVGCDEDNAAVGSECGCL